MKILRIALKDTLIVFRDRNALMLMIAAPLIIALVTGSAFGGGASDTSPISQIPVVIVNHDSGDFGNQFTDILTGIEVNTTDGEQGLFRVSEMDSLESAKSEIERGRVRGVIFFPESFSAEISGGASGATETQTSIIQIFTDPAASISPGILRGVVSRIATGFNMILIGNNIAINQVVEAATSGASSAEVLNNLNNLEDILTAETANAGETEAERNRINVSTSTVGDGEGFNLLNYFVPSMAIFFLMFTVFAGTRSILEEERDGTLHRLMSTPTSTSEIILGKISGTFMTGILQFVVLALISGLFFGVDWGKEPIGMALMVLATVAAATSLGAFIASFARNVNQAGVIGSAITTIFAVLGGNFIDFRSIPDWLTPISRLTINRWALEGFFNLTFVGQTLQEVALNITVLFGMAAFFFALAVLLFRRRFVS